jgi:hypothetical protein
MVVRLFFGQAVVIARAPSSGFARIGSGIYLGRRLDGDCELNLRRVMMPLHASFGV